MGVIVQVTLDMSVYSKRAEESGSPSFPRLIRPPHSLGSARNCQIGLSSHPLFHVPPYFQEEHSRGLFEEEPAEPPHRAST